MKGHPNPCPKYETRERYDIAWHYFNNRFRTFYDNK